VGQTIKVERRHIAESDKGEPESCMVTNAVRDALDLRDDVVVRTTYKSIGLYIKKPGTKRHGKPVVKQVIDYDLEGQIRGWDRGMKIQPFEFDLRFPDDWREKVQKARDSAKTETPNP